MELCAGLIMASLLETLVPFSIIFQQTTCKTGSLVGGMKDTIDPLEIIPILRTFNDCEECAQVESFTGRWMNEQHTANGELPVTKGPLPLLLLPNKFLREILVQIVIRFRNRL